uniref:Uncharacterized protein n=1 Tax=Rhizophora mucronata TaxID=61149 RepID=A0A2P2NDT0_RHIMU
MSFVRLFFVLFPFVLFSFG